MDDRELCEKRVGTTLRGKWTLERLLGVGGMAAVYVGLHKIGRRDAIKILHHDAARSNDTRARFEREAYAVNQLGHPGVVEIRDVDETEDGAPFLVMELLSGEPLSERAQRQGGVDIPELLRLIDELCDVLAAAHAQGIIHRDIKLDNLFVQRDGRLKVLDFGIVHMRDGDGFALKTRMGTKLGTVPYMPPEQIRGTPIDERADIFAVGATMFRLIAKRRIHEARAEQEVMLLMATVPAPSLASVAPDAPPDICLIVDRAIAFHREQRYPDAATMQRDVQAVRRGQPPPYATARIAVGDPPGAPKGQAALPILSATPFADTPTVIHVNSTGPDPAPAPAPAPAPEAPPVSPPPAHPTADMTPITKDDEPAGPRRSTIPMGPPNPRSSPVPAATEAAAKPALSPAALRFPLIAAAVLFALAIVGSGVWWALRSGAGDAPAPTRSAPASGSASPTAAPRQPSTPTPTRTN